jgi:hypothetical protein
MYYTLVTRVPLNFTLILQVKAKASKWHRDLQSTTPIILGTVPLTSYQPPVVPAGEKPPGDVNGETLNIPAGTGGATVGYNVQPSVGPPPIGEPEAPGSTGWSMLPSDPNAQTQGIPYIQHDIAPQVPAPSLYPDLCKYVRMSRIFLAHVTSKFLCSYTLNVGMFCHYSDLFCCRGFTL